MSRNARYDGEGLLVLDKDERILLANKAFSDALGKSPDELTGQKVTDLPFEFDEAQLAVEGFPWERAMREGEPQVGDILKLRVGPQKHRVLKSVPRPCTAMMVNNGGLSPALTM